MSPPRSASCSSLHPRLLVVAGCFSWPPLAADVPARLLIPRSQVRSLPGPSQNCAQIRASGPVRRPRCGRGQQTGQQTPANQLIHSWLPAFETRLPPQGGWVGCLRRRDRLTIRGRFRKFRWLLPTAVCNLARPSATRSIPGAPIRYRLAGPNPLGYLARCYRRGGRGCFRSRAFGRCRPGTSRRCVASRMALGLSRGSTWRTWVLRCVPA